MKGRKTGVVQHKQTKMCVSEKDFLHSGNFSASTLVIKVRQPEHTVQPEVCGHNEVLQSKKSKKQENCVAAFFSATLWF